jgi:hypothetical protein
VVVVVVVMTTRRMSMRMNISNDYVSVPSVCRIKARRNWKEKSPRPLPAWQWMEHVWGSTVPWISLNATQKPWLQHELHRVTYRVHV